jgi:hypothetical protein
MEYGVSLWGETPIGGKQKARFDDLAESHWKAGSYFLAASGFFQVRFGALVTSPFLIAVVDTRT